jgi:hypothetical protein
MADRKHFISIWFFIGLLLGVYGLLILGSGIYELVSPPAVKVEGGIERNVMANLHMAIWWGALLLVLGVVYAVNFRPEKKEK